MSRPSGRFATSLFRARYAQDHSRPASDAEVCGSRGRGTEPAPGLVAWLFDQENHIAAAGGIAQALENAHALNAGVDIQIEVETLEQLQQALAHGARSVLLDNFTLDAMREAVRITAGRALLEASGGVNLEQIRKIAATGVDRISIGKLTKDVVAVDYSLRIVA